MINGKFVHCFSVSIKADTHDECLFEYNRFKALTKAFLRDIHIHESKSARKGSVLGRDIQFTHTAYSPEIIIFSEAVRIIAQDINLFGAASAMIYEHSCVPDDNILGPFK